MRIGIDINEANVTNRVGSNQYAFEILKRIERIDKKNQFELFLSKRPVGDLPDERKNWTYKVLAPGFFWTQWRLPLDLFTRREKLDVFLSLGHYGPRFSRVPTVVTVMDLAFVYYPDFFRKADLVKLASWTKYSVKKAKKVIAISQNTKKDLIEQYSIKSEKVVVAYPGFDRDSYKVASSKQIEKVRSKYNLGDEYILYVGTLQPRKNLVRLVEAFERIANRNKGINLVLSGKQGWLVEAIKDKIEGSRYRGRIRLTGFVDNQDLPALYSGAICSTHMGLYEGFSLPALESLACGTIPVVANTGSLPEAVGKAAIMVDPFDIDSIGEGIKKAVKLRPEDKKRLLEEGNNQLIKFSWSESAQKIMEVVYEVANQG